MRCRLAYIELISSYGVLSRESFVVSRVIRFIDVHYPLPIVLCSNINRDNCQHLSNVQKPSFGCQTF